MKEDIFSSSDVFVQKWHMLSFM